MKSTDDRVDAERRRKSSVRSDNLGVGKRQRLDMRISYAIDACPLGRLLVAGTARGICAIYFGEADSPLEHALRNEYPQARISLNPSSVAFSMQRVIEHLAGRQARLSLPIDVQATAFQRRVWRELQNIPYGSKATYREISRRIGQPRASRAVGSACAKNPVSILIPCHRVIREDGGLGGYRWGLSRKATLLRQESAKKAT
jgi:AraC family transcriptional regulator, regulatory protein of adaptative response / methylated-DNA-[protein]-cysteine methyltransferase